MRDKNLQTFESAGSTKVGTYFKYRMVKHFLDKTKIILTRPSNVLFSDTRLEIYHSECVNTLEPVNTLRNCAEIEGIELCLQ